MPDTYNPDEIVKLKHLNEFARQLRVKLDGQTDPKPARTITSFKFLSRGSYSDVPNDGIINVTTANLSNNSLRFQIKTPYAGSAPVIENYIDTPVDTQDTITQLAAITWTGPSGLADRRDLWQIHYQCDLNGTISITPRTITFNLHFDETKDYQAYDREITVNVTGG